jgi:outer membrane receptor protein involved in Fe transport
LKDDGHIVIEAVRPFSPQAVIPQEDVETTFGNARTDDAVRRQPETAHAFGVGLHVGLTWLFNEWRPDPHTLERIEVLRGPSSVLYGDTSTAGLLNLISKRPQATESHEIGVQYGSLSIRTPDYTLFDAMIR